VAFPEELSDVIPEGLARVLPATLQIQGVARPHVCVLEVTSQDLLEILPVVNCVFGQVVKPSPGRVGEVNGEELHDEEVIICPARPACKAIVFQPNIGIRLTGVLDDIIRCSEALREAPITRVAPERLEPQSLRAEATPLLVVAPVATRITCVMLGACALIPRRA
jgi:hypothetical protein